MQLNVAAPVAATSDRDVRIGEGRIEEGVAMAQLDREHVARPRFARVHGPHDPVHVTEPVCPGRAANETGPGRLVVHARALGIEEVRCDAGPLHLQPFATVGVLEMTPGR